MVKKFELEPENKDSEEFFSNYIQNQNSFWNTLNTYRNNKLEDNKNIFELRKDLLSSNSTEITVPPLFYQDMCDILLLNGILWKEQLIHNPLKKSDPPNSIPDQLEEIPIKRYTVIKDNVIEFNPICRRRVQYKINIEQSHIDIKRILGNSKMYIHPQESSLVLIPDEDIKQISSYANSDKDEHSDFAETISGNTYIEILKISQNICRFSQITINPTQLETIKMLCNNLQVEMEVVDENTVMLYNSVEKYNEIRRFLEKDVPSRTLKDYYELYDFPTHVTHITEKDSVLNLSGEEYLYYGVQNGEISHELSKYAPFIQFRPQPTVSSIKEALKRAKHKQNDLKSATHLIKKVTNFKTDKMYVEYKETLQNRTHWPILPTQKLLL